MSKLSRNGTVCGLVSIAIFAAIVSPAPAHAGPCGGYLPPCPPPPPDPNEVKRKADEEAARLKAEADRQADEAARKAREEKEEFERKAREEKEHADALAADIKRKAKQDADALAAEARTVIQVQGCSGTPDQVIKCVEKKVSAIKTEVDGFREKITGVSSQVLACLQKSNIPNLARDLTKDPGKTIARMVRDADAHAPMPKDPFTTAQHMAHRFSGAASLNASGVIHIDYGQFTGFAWEQIEGLKPIDPGLKCMIELVTPIYKKDIEPKLIESGKVFEALANDVNGFVTAEMKRLARTAMKQVVSDLKGQLKNGSSRKLNDPLTGASQEELRKVVAGALAKQSLRARNIKGAVTKIDAFAKLYQEKGASPEALALANDLPGDEAFQLKYAGAASVIAEVVAWGARRLIDTVGATALETYLKGSDSLFNAYHYAITATFGWTAAFAGQSYGCGGLASTAAAWASKEGWSLGAVPVIRNAALDAAHSALFVSTKALQGGLEANATESDQHAADLVRQYLGTEGDGLVKDMQAEWSKEISASLQDYNRKVKALAVKLATAKPSL